MIPGKVHHLSTNTMTRKATPTEKIDAAALFPSFKEKVLSEFSEKALETSGLIVPGYLDATLMRFFNARNGKEADALKMLRDSMQWRSTVNMEKFLRQGSVLSPEKLDAIRRLHPQGCHKWDKEGNLLYIEPTGGLDPEGLLQFGTVQEAIDYHIQKWEFTQHFMFPQAVYIYIYIYIHTSGETCLRRAYDSFLVM
jgi:hypothetical protein